MKKIINFYFDERIKNKKRIKLVKKYKFDGIFLMCDEQFEENVKLARKYKLYIETAHLPYRNLCNNLWIDTKLGEDYVECIIDWIKLLGKNDIHKAVIHTAATKTPPVMNSVGIERLKRIVKVCEEEKVVLAMENVHNWEYVLKPLSFIESDYLGICLDFGHANCFTKNIYDIDYSWLCKKLACVHIHDNLGSKDDHLVPFDGNIDYNFVFDKLKENGFDLNITLELESELFYNNTKTYLSKAKESVERLVKLYEL